MPTSFDFTAKTMNDSNEGIILNAVQTRIASLSLSQINSNNIVVRSMPWDQGLTPPYVIVSPMLDVPQWDGGTNEKDRETFGVMVSIVVANNRDLSTTKMAISLYWRQRVRRTFQNVSINTFNPSLLTGCFLERVFVENGEKFIAPAKRIGYDAQYLLLRFQIKEGRETS